MRKTVPCRLYATAMRLFSGSGVCISHLVIKSGRGIAAPPNTIETGNSVVLDVRRLLAGKQFFQHT